MAAQEKPQILDRRRTQMLAAMGIVVWYARPHSDGAEQSGPEPIVSAAAPVVESQAAIAPQGETQSEASAPDSPVIDSAEASAPAVKLEFAWLKGSRTMLLLSKDASRETQQHAKDIVRYADWLQQQSTSTSPSGGHFSWPQLSDTTTGTPLRALRVFIDKHFTDQSPWFLLGDDVAASIESWLRELSSDQQTIQIIVLQQLCDSVGDVGVKKQIWQTLKQTS
jgi:hypothetical protein